jgi:hypothetical protein
MKFIFNIFILLVFSFSNSYAEIKFGVQEDEFTDDKIEYIVDTRGESIEVEKSLERVKYKFLSLSCIKETVCAISFAGYYDDWNELGTDNAYVILDGEKWNNHDFQLDTEINDDLLEDYRFLYSKEDFNKIIQSSLFRAKVGNLVFSIDLTQLPMSDFTL